MTGISEINTVRLTRAAAEPPEYLFLGDSGSVTVIVCRISIEGARQFGTFSIIACTIAVGAE